MTGMSTKEMNRCLRMTIYSISRFQLQWKEEKCRLIRSLENSRIELDLAKENLEAVDKENTKALKSATNAHDNAVKKISSLEDEIKKLKEKILNGYSEAQRYHDRIGS